MAKLTINGVRMPPIAYNGAQKSRNKMWSANSGRNDNGDAVGTIKKIKTKWEITFVPLSQEQTNLVESVISDIDNAFVPVVLELNSGEIERFTAYSGDITYPLLWDTDTATIYNGVKVSLIEQ